MTRFRRVASAFVVSSAVVSIAVAQAPLSPSTTPSPTPGAKANQPRPAPANPLHPKRRSIVHHYPYPYPGYYNYDQTAGYRNPGGAGRYAEYYPPGNQFQAEQDPVRVATFDRGGGPNWDEQRASQQVGIARYNSIQQSIDRYAAPRVGIGFFGGFN